jgi:type I restriction enzyme, S subunit
MGSNWHIVQIEEIAEKVAMGPFGSDIKVETFVQEGVPIISGTHLHGIKLEDKNFNYITNEHSQRLKNSNVFRGDIIFTHAGSIGQVSYIPENSKYERYILSQRQFYLRCNRAKAVPEYIAYFFKTNEGQHKLLANKSQVGVPSIAKPSSYLKTIEINLPSLDEQRSIAHLLSTLDDKIELYNRINETLESIVRAIFKSWFVDFDPIRAKANGEIEESICNRLGLTPELLALFPDSFAESKPGEIPEGWEETNIEKVAESIFSGGTPDTRRNDFWNGNVNWLSSGETRNHFIISTDKKITRLGVESSSTREAIPGDILIASAGQGNTRGQTSYCAVTTYINQSIISIRANRTIVHPFWLFYNLSRRYEEMRALSDSQSSRGSLTTKLIGKMKLILPKFEIISFFGELCYVLVQMNLANRQQCISLGNIRNTLLPKLISGELRIPNGDKQ